MARRRLKVGDVVVLRPEAIDALKREGYRDVKAHASACITDSWTINGRRVLELGMWCETHDFGAVKVAVWPSQVRLADGRAERDRVAAEKHVAALVAAKAAREASRRIPRRKP